MKKTSPYLDRDRELEIKMTPMIDVVFLLLVFFVWTASFSIVENSLNAELTSQLGEMEVQQDDPPPEIDFDEVVIRIFWGDQPTWTINDLPMESFDDLKDRLQRIAKIKNDASLIIHPEQNVPLGAVINVFDTSQLAGFLNVQFATNMISE
ncbi:biopolymer transporter ExbD [Pirellulaceae bacterium]|jgi:biopolymer transport protein ExbD|nr:biopolymer transporter ExbD [Pirellulaceae bacterium]